MYNSATSNSAKGGNKGSCTSLAKYLDKETKNQWFNHSDFDIETRRVIREIDKYGKGQIKKSQWKFIELEYCPSEEEQKQIIRQAGLNVKGENYEEYSAEEIEKIKRSFMNYVRKAQDTQAKNYNREGIESGADLKWFAKIEMFRKSKGFEEPYKTLGIKKGFIKPYFSMHCHVIQSRKAMNKKTQLSPLTNFRKKSAKNVIKQGFDRNLFTNDLEELFDNHFNYKRQEEEKYEYMKYRKFKGKPTRKIGKESFVLTKEKKQQIKEDTPLEKIVKNWKKGTYPQIINYLENNDIYIGDFEDKLGKDWDDFNDLREEYKLNRGIRR